jgi:hypothetical protein
VRALRVYVLDGTVVQKVPKRLRPLRGRRGSVLGGKGRAAVDVRRGVGVALATAADGETTDAKLVADRLRHVRAVADQARLFVADRQCCHLTQPPLFRQNGDPFLVRYHSKPPFPADAARPRQTHRDAAGRWVHPEWGWLGPPGQKRRRSVRRITLERPDDEALVLVTDLVAEHRASADALLALYLQRWGGECVCQQITAVFPLRTRRGTTPQGTRFQLAFCLLLYNLIQVVRVYVAQGQQREAATISTAMLCDEVRRDLGGVHEVLGTTEIVALFVPLTGPPLCRRLKQVLGGCWSPLWAKAPSQRRRHPERLTARSEHTSVYRILEQYRRANKEPINTTGSLQQWARAAR